MKRTTTIRNPTNLW